MKKIFLFLAVASMTAFTSCSSDDDSNDGGTTDPNAATGVVLASNVQSITLGESVTFTVTDNNANVVTGASTLLVNNVEISGATFTPDAAGSFEVKATYMNSNDVTLTSNTVTITVAEPVVAAGKYTYNGTDYDVDNMIFQVNGASTSGIVLVNIAPEGEPENWGSLWLGVGYNGVLDNLATASHYYQYTFFIPAIANADDTYTVQFPGEATAVALDTYVEENLVVLNTDNVTTGTATFTSFDLGATADDIPFSNNASSFTDGTTVVVSHEFDGDLEGVFYGDLTSGAKTANFKNIPTQRITMKELKKANRVVKLKK